MNTAVISLGSNIDPDRYIAAACQELAVVFTLRSKSSFVRTSPVGFPDQADFVNGVVLIETDDALDVLKGKLKALEAKLGRQPRENKWGPREIDLDVLIWNGKVVNQDYFERDFLQKAVREILPDFKNRCC